MEIQDNQLVVHVLKCVEYVVNSYPIQGKVWITIRLGSEGMGPNIAVEFQGSQFDKSAPGGDITFWLQGDKTKFVLIYMMLDPKSDEHDHCSVELSELNQIESYFDRAISMFALSDRNQSQTP
jgi:hypothetical protein